MVKIEKGDFIKIDYSARLAAINQLFDTTSMEKAKEEKIFDEHSSYSPLLVVVGKGHVIKGLDEALEGMSLGEEKKLEIPPEKGFGIRDPNLVKILPIAEFKKRDINPFPGMSIDLDGAKAIVRSVSGGRVMVDLNHALAGEKLVYEFKIVEKLDTLDSRIKAMLERFNLKNSEFKVDNDILEVSFPKEIKKDVNFVINKSNLIASLLQLVNEIKKIKVVEEYDKSTSEIQETQKT
jgi:FKBP-type peptidyl-prolyl cis-trans isomerase 2